MHDLDQRYDVIGADGFRIGEAVKRSFYGIQGEQDEGVLTEAGLVDASGELLACWEADRHGSAASSYLKVKT